MKHESQVLDRKVVSLIASGWILVAAILLWGDSFSRFEGQSFDLRTRYAIQFRAAPSTVKIIAIDQQSLTYLDEQGISWPWFRSVYGVALNVLKKAGARGIAIDMLYTEGRNDRPDDDQEFVDAVASSIPIVLATQLQTKKRSSDVADFQAEKLYVTARKLEKQKLKGAQSALLPIDPLVRASTALGNVSSLRDSDGVFRRYVPYFLLNDQFVPGLSVSLMHITHPEVDPSEIIRPYFRDGTVAVKFYGPEHTIQTIPFAAVFDAFVAMEQGTEPKLDLGIFKDSYVFMGVTAPGLFDNLSVPVADLYPGVEVNATVLANLLEGEFVYRFSWLENMALAIFWIILATLTPFQFTSLTRLAGLLFVALFTFIALHTGFVVLGYWSAMVLPLLCMLGSMLTAFAYQYNTEGKKRRYIRSAFSHYLSQDVIENLLENPDALALGGERRELTIFFSDIAGFTTMSEKVDPTKLVALLNDYLTEVTEIIFKTEGTLDKYIGDAVMCFWNAPAPVSDHADRAVQTALEIQATLAVANQHFKDTYGLHLITRIGIHTGDAIVGNFGSKRRFDYTIVGDAVNTAARLEGLNKVFGTNLLISDATRLQCTSNVKFRRLGSVQVAGKTEALEVFEPVPAETELASYDAAYDSFLNGDIKQAYALFKALEDDPVAASYIERIESEELLESSASEFNPIWILSKK